MKGSTRYMFPQVPNMFHKGFPNSTLPLSLRVCSKFSPSQLYKSAKGEALHFTIKTLMLGSFPSFKIYMFGNE